MKKLSYLAVALLLSVGLSLAAPPKTFVGSISDGMCGLKHSMGGSDKDCTVECVKAGDKYVLADEANQKVYQLSDQAAAGKFPGVKVKVTGTLKGDTIQVTSIEAAK